MVEKSYNGTLLEDQDNITLTCLVENGTKPEYKWFKNNRTVKASERHVFLQNNRVLFISPVKKEDIGAYNCSVSNPISHFQGKPMDLSVYCECYTSLCSLTAFPVASYFKFMPITPISLIYSLWSRFSINHLGLCPVSSSFCITAS